MTCENIILRAFEFSDDQEKERILTYMKSIALGAQQERDFLPTKQWNTDIQDYERKVASDSWDAGTTLVRLLGYRTGRSLSTKTSGGASGLHLVWLFVISVPETKSTGCGTTV